MTIYVPTITYQYSAEGELDNGAPTAFEFTPDVRARFRVWFTAKYHNHAGAFERLQELVRASLERLPDNPFVQRDAWLAGVTDEQNSYVRGWFESYAAGQERARQEAEADRARDERRRESEQRLEVRVIRPIREVAEGPGAEIGQVVEVKDRTTGEALRFAVRNIFDFGRVINPEYRIAPGIEGGVVNVDPETRGLYWMHFTSGRGWERVRNLTPFESVAIRYLEEFSAVSGEIRL